MSGGLKVISSPPVLGLDSHHLVFGRVGMAIMSLQGSFLGFFSSESPGPPVSLLVFPGHLHACPLIPTVPLPGLLLGELSPPLAFGSLLDYRKTRHVCWASRGHFVLSFHGKR